MIEIAFKKMTAIDAGFCFLPSYLQTFFRDRSHQVAQGVSIKCFHWTVAWGHHENSRHQRRSVTTKAPSSAPTPEY